MTDWGRRPKAPLSKNRLQPGSDCIVTVKNSVIVLLLGLMFLACSEKRITNKVIFRSELQWQQLNPARGAKSPKAANLWGDRNGAGPTGFLVEFVDGFSSPPHIHNVSYRGVVISGLIHNDHKNAPTMYMPVGSFWVQPKGQAHITAARGSYNLAFIEIEQGPYLVRPPGKAFTSAERAVNIDYSNLVFLQTSSFTHAGVQSQASPQIAYLWGKPAHGNLYGTLIKLPRGFEGTIASSGKTFYGVLIKGQLDYTLPAAKAASNLEPGSLFSSEGNSTHKIKAKQADTLVYVRTNGPYQIK